MVTAWLKMSAQPTVGINRSAYKVHPKLGSQVLSEDIFIKSASVFVGTSTETLLKTYLSNQLVCVCMCACVCVVCVRERERETDRQTETDRDTEAETERQRQRAYVHERKKDRDRKSVSFHVFYREHRWHFLLLKLRWLTFKMEKKLNSLVTFNIVKSPKLAWSCETRQRLSSCRVWINWR